MPDGQNTNGIGAAVKRREDFRFLTGQGRYTDDTASLLRLQMRNMESLGDTPPRRSRSRVRQAHNTHGAAAPRLGPSARLRALGT